MVTDPLIGRRLANFRIERVIGRGGMAVVYYGWDVKLNRPVAIKVIDARYQRSPSYAQRFVREAQAVAAWRHENIIPIYYADDQEGLYYFVMEYVDGQDLASLLSQYAAAGEFIGHDDVIRVGRAVASALDYAHQKGVIHRDVKPSNILVARDGRVVLGDFGLAMDVQQGSIGEVVGTPHYLAPEQARRSADAVPQSDLYSLGVVLYEMLTGSVPFDDPSPASLALQHLTLPPPPPRSLNPALNVETESILLKALSKSPNDRYQTGRELIDALEKSLRTREPASAPAPALPPMPAAVHEAARHPARVSLVERIAIEKPPAPQPRPVPRKRAAWIPLTVMGAAGGMLLIGAMVVGLGFGILGRGGENSTTAPTVTNAATGIAGLTAPPLVSSPTAAPLATATAASSAESTQPPVPTFTVAPTVALSPTVLYPNGRRFLLIYNDNSFYLFNASSNDSAVTPLAFERLDADGVPLNRFEGWRWAQFYPTINPGRCMSLEILDSQPHLRPAECGGLYNSVRTPAHTDDTIFWTAREGSRQFRALWNDEEVARCEIAAGLCEIFLP